MEIKGHAKVELRNIKTGEVEVYEDDNLVTNALAYYMKDIGMLGASPFVVNDTVRNDPIHQLMGGLLLLDTALTESADNVILPGGVKMIGNGAYDVAADGQDRVSELGSWSELESGWQNDGSIKMVWDFAAQQANTPQGKSIACICLTSANHGYIGEGNGNPDGASKSEKRSDYTLGGSPQDYKLDGNADTAQRVLKIVSAINDSSVSYIPEHNFFYDATYANEHMKTADLKVVTQFIPITDLDIRASYPRNNNGGDEHITKTETTITLPGDFKSALGDNAPWHAGRHGDYYYMIAPPSGGNYLAAGGSVKGVKIDIANMTATSFTISNALSKTIGFSERNIMFGRNTVAIAATYGDYAYEVEPIVYFQNLSTPADVTMVQGFPVTSDSFCAVQNYEDHAEHNGYRIDFTDRSVLPINGEDRSKLGSPLVVDNPLLQTYIDYDGDYWRNKTLRLYRSTNYIATINNLQTPVQKTAEKTMKITYTLRFS